MRLLVGLICLFTIPFTMLSLWDWAAITEDPRADWRSKRLVSLADELALLDQFLALVTIRYADGLTVSVHVDAQAVHRWQLPPVVLPELRENAVKHNECLADNPLQIEVRLEGDRLTVSHDKRPRLDRGVLDGGRPAEPGAAIPPHHGRRGPVADSGGRFIVTLPLLADPAQTLHNG